MSLFSKLLIGVMVVASCSTVKSNNYHIKEKKAPEYQGVDPILQPYVNSYLRLSAEKHIYFSHFVTVGFRKLGPPGERRVGQKQVVGLCNYSDSWREIDIDPDFWSETSSGKQSALMFHELTHCYCGRSHDYGKDKSYPEENLSTLFNGLASFLMIKPDPGFYPDDCPLSIMYPVLPDEQCIESHWNDYLTEMFDRCEPF
jgi:hypothetical protein